MQLSDSLSDTDQLDESDRRLVEALKKGIARGTYKVGVDGEQQGGEVRSPDGVAQRQDVPGQAGQACQAKQADDPMGGDFMAALNAYRAAKRTGDADVIARAEKHLHDATRAELQATEGCVSDGTKPVDPGGFPGMDPSGMDPFSAQGGSCAFGSMR